jgi:predicted nucleic acid-binding protein
LPGTLQPALERADGSLTVLRATELSETAGIDFRDALIAAAAAQSGAETLYSEDLNDGQLIAGVRVVNPLH